MRDTIELAREAGGFGYVHDAGDEPHKWQFTPAELKAFEALVRADERARLQPKKIKAVKDEYCHGDERYYANE
jgi:hypothetical protein